MSASAHAPSACGPVIAKSFAERHQASCSAGVSATALCDGLHCSANDVLKDAREAPATGTLHGTTAPFHMSARGHGACQQPFRRPPMANNQLNAIQHETIAYARPRSVTVVALCPLKTTMQCTGAACSDSLKD